MTDDERIKQIKERVNDMRFQSSEEMQDFIEDDIPWLLEQIEIRNRALLLCNKHARKILNEEVDYSMGVANFIEDAKQNMQEEEK